MKTVEFDPNAAGLDNGNYFGLPFTAEESRLVLLSVPWDVTSSYGTGSRFAPEAIIGASSQLDLYEPLYPQGWREGIGTIPIEYSIQEKSGFLRTDAEKVMKHLERGGKVTDDHVLKHTARINKASSELNEYVYKAASEWMDRRKLAGLVGGDHSTPYGFIKAVAERCGAISILHIDAHADLRLAYEGFEFSHASIMYNVIQNIPEVESLLQVGVRDLCDCEAETAKSNPKIEQFSDYGLASNRFRGVTWEAQCDGIIERLGENVYISFDIDGLSPDNSPNTGTPVPGGMSFNEAVYMINKIACSGRTIAGFDLCEVAPPVNGEWDANVGARILYKLCSLTLKSNKKE